MPLMNGIMALLNNTPAGFMNCRQILNALESNQCHTEDWVPSEQREIVQPVAADQLEKKSRQQ